MHSIITFKGNGTTVRFPITFTLGYLRKEYVSCRVDDEVDSAGNALYRPLTWDDNDPNYVVVGGNVPVNGANIVFTRTVPIDDLLYDFQSGAHLSNTALNESHEQLMMAIHQMIDTFDITYAELIQKYEDFTTDIEQSLADTVSTLTDRFLTLQQYVNTNLASIRADFTALGTSVDTRFAAAMADIRVELDKAIVDAIGVAEVQAGLAVAERFNTLKATSVIVPDSIPISVSYENSTNTLTFYLHETSLPAMSSTVRGGATVGTGLKITSPDKLEVDFASDAQLQIENSSQPPTAGQLASLYTRVATLEGNRVLRAGDTMTGTLNVGASGTNRSYVGGTAIGTRRLYLGSSVLSEDSHVAHVYFQTVRPDGTVNQNRSQIMSMSQKSSQPTGTPDDPALIIRSYGQLIMGSGESATTVRAITTTGENTAVPTGWARLGITAGAWSDDSELTTVASDSSMMFMTGCNTVANSKMMLFDNSGNLVPGTASGQSLGTKEWRWNAELNDVNILGNVVGLTAEKLGYTEQLTTPGWVKLPNGIVFQWGYFWPPVSAAGSSYSTGTFPFPVAFPHQAFTVVLGGYPYRNPNASDFRELANFNLESITLTTFTVSAYRYWHNRDLPYDSRTFYIAVGN